jgi:hypothetical protein
MQLVDKYRPQTIGGFAGVERAKAILSAFVQKPYESAWLLIGPSGVGKTTMAFAAAVALGAKQEIGGGIYHIPARKCDLDTIDSVSEQCHYAPMVGCPWNVVIIDEGDQMTNAAQLALLSKLDSADPVPNTIWFITANETTKLEERFLSRCRKIQFTTDGLLEPGAKLLRKIWKAETKGVKGERPTDPDFDLILRTAKFNIREALMLLETEILCPGSVCEEAPIASRTFSDSRGSTPVGKGNGAGTVYTIGCEGYTMDSLADVGKALGVHRLVDCCWKPRRAFRSVLDYQWKGDALSGGRTAEKDREDGLKWLIGQITAGKNVMLMYPSENPGACNRHFVIAMDLLKRGVDCIHVFDNQLILASEFQASIEEERDYRFKTWRLPKAVGA